MGGAADGAVGVAVDNMGAGTKTREIRSKKERPARKMGEQHKTGDTNSQKR